MADNPDHDREEQRSRADAIRRKRDKYNATPADDSVETPVDPSNDPSGEEPESDSPHGPNYAAWIQKKMRERKDSA